MVAIRGYNERRRATRECLHSTFVEADEFVRLLLSRRELVRSDDSDGNVRGLLDLKTGRRFLIVQEKLFLR